MRPFVTFTILFGVLLGAPAHAQNDYPLTRDSLPQAGVPQGEVTHSTWKSRVFPGTVRDYWVYVPKQYDPEKPACVMVFQDGGGFQDRNSGFRVPVVFDNLIARGEMPVTVAIMIDPGVVPASGADQMARYNRSYEYDAPTGAYARFLLEEILPEVGKKLNLTRDPNGRAICGASSGGICAFTSAWERPDAFRRVLSCVGSFTNLRGGHIYPSLIRKHEPKPIRVFLQDGSNDQDIYSGSWFIGNNDVAAALKYAGYDYKYVVGTGGHDGRQGTAILPDALRWLWRDYPAPITAHVIEHNPGLDVLIDGESWKLIEAAGDSNRSVISDPAGDIYTADRGGPICKLIYGQERPVNYAATARNGIVISPSGVLYCAEDHGIMAYDQGRMDYSRSMIGRRAKCLIADHAGRLYATDARSGAVVMIDSRKDAHKIDPGFPDATAIQLSADQSLLFLARAAGNMVYSYHIEQDGTVSARQPYFDLYMQYGETGSGASAMVTDTQGRLYVATTAGIQLLDQPGRVNGIISPPSREPVTGLAWGGRDLDTLYAVSGGKLYARKMKAHGVVSTAPPVKLPAPRL